MQITIKNSKEELAVQAAKYVAGYINANPDKLLCLAAGDTPLAMMAELVAMQGRGEVRLDSVYYVGLDEWVGIGYETKGSCAQVMRDHFYGPANIPPQRMRIWDGLAQDLDAQCAGMEAWIARRGGIGLTVLGIGMNGHIGFNEPGAPLDGTCITIDLDAVTADVGRKYFDGNACPTKGITVGLSRLLAAEEVALMATGAHKAPVTRKALMENPTTQVPASCLQDHPRLQVFIDRELLKSL